MNDLQNAQLISPISTSLENAREKVTTSENQYYPHLSRINRRAVKMKYLLFLIFPILFNCQTEKVVSKYPAQVGDIQFNAKMDDANFKKCGEGQAYSFQYYNTNSFQYKGEKIAIQNGLEKLNISGDKNLNNYITIRFIVNCEGKTGQFRIQQMDLNYKEIPVDKKLGDQLLNFTKSLKGWIPKKIENHQIDFYQYLTFKIKNGKVSEILP